MYQFSLPHHQRYWSYVPIIFLSRRNLRSGFDTVEMSSTELLPWWTWEIQIVFFVASCSLSVPIVQRFALMQHGEKKLRARSLCCSAYLCWANRKIGEGNSLELWECFQTLRSFLGTLWNSLETLPKPTPVFLLESIPMVQCLNGDRKLDKKLKLPQIWRLVRFANGTFLDKLSPIEQVCTWILLDPRLRTAGASGSIMGLRVGHATLQLHLVPTPIQDSN